LKLDLSTIQQEDAAKAKAENGSVIMGPEGMERIVDSQGKKVTQPSSGALSTLFNMAHINQ